MGKKMKPKSARNPRKAPARSPSDLADRTPSVSGEAEAPKSISACNHYNNDSSNLNRILLAVQSSLDVAAACEHCREEQNMKRGGKEKGKQHKKKGGGAKNVRAKSESNFVWVCLDCDRCFCGGAVNVSVPYGHARRHSKQDRHPWAVRLDDPSVSWCFMCDASVPIELPEVFNSEAKSAVEECSEGSGLVRVENGGEKGYVVRGLANLGNTCFFNSVMQNLLAMDRLRDYLAGLNSPAGPLTMALKKLFVETSLAADCRGVLNPKALFGCICAKAPQFRGFQQQDSHELLRYLLDGLHTEETSMMKLVDSSDEKDKDGLSSDASFVDVLFGGQLSSTVSCVECGYSSTVHEPFLDLSLSLPSKKPPPKKVPPPPGKRNKLPPREGYRSRKLREKAVAKGPLPPSEHPKAESSGSPSECSASGVTVPDQEPQVTYGGDSDFAWMDYLEPNKVADAADCVPEECESSAAQCSDGVKAYQNEGAGHCSADSVTEACSNELVGPQEPSVESSCADEVPLSTIQDSCVILLPYKCEATVEETHGQGSCSSKPNNIDSADAQAKESSTQSASVGGYVQTEEEFDGFGDLFNEPEVTSNPRTETGMEEDVEMTLWTGNSSESTQDVVDDTDAPVSVNSCLALFTKPELLSNEHAWYCERCSDILHGRNVVQNNCKRRVVERFTQQSKSDVNVSQPRNKRTLPDLGVNPVDSPEMNALGNGKVSSTSLAAVSHIERLDPRVDLTVEPLTNIAGSDGLTCKFQDATNGKSLILSDPISSNQAWCPDVIMEDEDLTKSDHTSDRTSHPFGNKKAILCSSCHENGSCSISNSACVKCDGQDLAAVSSSALDYQKTALQSSCENDCVAEVNQVGQESAHSAGEIHSEDGSGDEDMKRERRKVKRDAMKRFLIHRSPPILTIHLKRFSQDARGRLNKLRGHVLFREMLDLKPYMDSRCEDIDKCSYRLVGVVEHSGGMSGGHYVAYVRGESGKGKAQKSCDPAWFYASDAHIREVSLTEVLQSDAYILFYERCSHP